MKIEDIENLCNEATISRWEYKSSTGTVIAIDIDNGHTICSPIHSDFDLEQSEANGKFIAASRTLMPKLLAVAKAAKELYLEEKSRQPWHDPTGIPESLMKAIEELEKE